MPTLQEKHTSPWEKEIGLSYFFIIKMRVEKFSYNDFDDLNANTYVVINEGEAIVIDPSVDDDKIGDFLIKSNLKLVMVLLTHGHFDHMRGVDRLIKRFNCPFYIHFNDEKLLVDETLNCSYFENTPIIVKSKAITLSGDEEFNVLKDTLKVIHTPFHTEGSVCYYFINNKLLFSGDTLFMNSIGRDDLPTSNRRKRNSSLDKIKLLPKECKIYPGHGPNTSLNKELLLNHFLQL